MKDHMAWIKTLGLEEATGRLKEQYDAAMQRAGRIWNIVRIMSLNPPVLDASMKLYRQAMFGKSPLTRAHRELLAVIVSAVNRCTY